MEHTYAKQKLYEAVDALISSGSTQERLTFAAVPLVILSGPRGEVPAEIQGRLESLLKTLTKNNAEPLSNAQGYTPRNVTDAEARKLAEQILSLFIEVMGGL